MDLIKKLFKFNGESYLNYIKSTINNSKEIRNKILKEELDTQQKIKLLIDDTYTFNILIKCLLTKLLITNNKMELEYYDKCNSIIDEYNYNFNTDVELLTDTSTSTEYTTGLNSFQLVFDPDTVTSFGNAQQIYKITVQTQDHKPHD